MPDETSTGKDSVVESKRMVHLLGGRGKNRVLGLTIECS